MRGDRRADRRKGSPGFPSSSCYGGAVCRGARREVAGHRYVRVFDRQWQVRQTGQRRATSGWHMMPQGNLMSVCRAGLPQVGQGTAEEFRGGKADRSGTGVQKAHSGEKERWPSASGGLERRKERPCGRSRCVQDDAGRLQRLTGDNVRPLMRPAPRQGGSAGGAVRKEEHGSASGRGVRSQAEEMRIKKALAVSCKGEIWWAIRDSNPEPTD